MSIRNQAYEFIDFDFVELRFATVLLLPRSHGERRTESRFIGMSSAQPKSIYVIEHFPNPNTNIKELVKTELNALKNFDINCQIYKPFTEHSLYLLFQKTGLKILDKIEIPYYGKRTIRKYFFKLK